MLRFLRLTPALAAVSLALTTGCSASKESKVTVASPTPNILLKASPSPETSQVSSNLPKPDFFQDGLHAALGASSISQSALSKEDWGLVSSHAKNSDRPGSVTTPAEIVYYRTATLCY